MIAKKCPNCSAPVTYHGGQNIYKCEYCNSEFRDDNKVSGKAVQEKKIIYEYHHVNLPKESQLAETMKKRRTSGFLRFIFAVLGSGSALMGAGAFTVNQLVAGLVLICIGIWPIALASKRQ